MVPGSIPKIILGAFCDKRLFLMGMLRHKNIKIFLNYWLGPVIFIWLIWSIYNQVRHQPDLASSAETILSALSGSGAWKFWTVIALMFLNWGIESIKWKVLHESFYHMSRLRALKAVLAGVAFAINTPNRIGEYGGRVLYLPEGKRLQSVSLTIIGSYSQLLITLLAGTAGLWLLYSGSLVVHLPETWGTYVLWLRILCILLTTITLLLLLIYLRISWMVRLIERLPGVEKWGKALFVIDHLPVTILLRVLGWSLLRYVVFLFQYILLLQCFGVTNDSWTASWLVSIQFVILAIIPTIALAEVGIRGKLALELFGWISANQVGIISAAVSLWLVNLVVPALIGSLLIMRIKIFTDRVPQEK